MQTVLMTGAAGGIGRRLRPLLRGKYPTLRLSDIQPIDDLADGETFVQADLADADQVAAAVAGVDAIIHLGGHSVEGPWDVIHQANIVGCYNVFEAAREAGCGRVVFASSNHAVGFYPRDQRVGVDEKIRPDSRYGVSKVFGEALGALYADKYALRVMCIRIGNVDDEPIDQRRLSIWLHPDDLVQLIDIGLNHPELRYEVVYGASDCARGWWDNSAAERLGYRPRHRAEDFAERALARQAELAADPVGDRHQGGTFCSAEYVKR